EPVPADVWLTVPAVEELHRFLSAGCRRWMPVADWFHTDFFQYQVPDQTKTPDLVRLNYLRLRRPVAQRLPEFHGIGLLPVTDAATPAAHEEVLPSTSALSGFQRLAPWPLRQLPYP